LLNFFSQWPGANPGHSQPGTTMTLFRPDLTIMQTGSLLLRGYLAVIIGAARKRIAAALEQRRTRSALGKLDDYMLKDMGIARSDIERIANRTYPPR
jgi:uncharacterized protein YjiS (DUF1127 family)